MGFLDQVAADNSTFISDFSETITYTPKGGTTKTIKAVVTRTTEQRISEEQYALADEITIYVSAADVPTVDRDGDTVGVALTYGGALVTKTVRNFKGPQDGALRGLIVS